VPGHPTSALRAQRALLPRLSHCQRIQIRTLGGLRWRFGQDGAAVDHIHQIAATSADRDGALDGRQGGKRCGYVNPAFRNPTRGARLGRLNKPVCAAYNLWDAGAVNQRPWARGHRHEGGGLRRAPSGTAPAISVGAVARDGADATIRAAYGCTADKICTTRPTKKPGRCRGFKFLP
jgi:hypothetical protein